MLFSLNLLWRHSVLIKEFLFSPNREQCDAFVHVSPFNLFIADFIWFYLLPMGFSFLRSVWHQAFRFSTVCAVLFKWNPTWCLLNICCCCFFLYATCKFEQNLSLDSVILSQFHSSKIRIVSLCNTYINAFRQFCRNRFGSYTRYINIVLSRRVTNNQKFKQTQTLNMKDIICRFIPYRSNI